jgi:hypothetical protein
MLRSASSVRERVNAVTQSPLQQSRPEENLNMIQGGFVATRSESF